MLDLTDVPDSGFGLVPDGTYRVVMSEATMKSTKDGSGEYVNAKLTILNGEYANRVIWTMFNVKNNSAKATEIGLQQLKHFMKCSGSTEFKIRDVRDLVGLTCDAVIKSKRDDFGEKNVVSYFKESDKNDTLPAPKKQKDDVPF